MDNRKAVFVGGVPRPLKASELAEVMTEKFGTVSFVAIDCDCELKYPKGIKSFCLNVACDKWCDLQLFRFFVYNAITCFIHSPPQALPVLCFCHMPAILLLFHQDLCSWSLVLLRRR